MVGLSHFAVRSALREWAQPGISYLWSTEMLSSKRLPSQNKNGSLETLFLDSNLFPQLLGNEEKCIRESIKKLQDWGAKAIDINMGCPVDQALRHNYGVALMGDVDYAARVTHYAVKHASVPVSVKLRSGVEATDEIFLLRFVKALQNSGAAWLTLHPRHATQLRRGSAKWEVVKRIKEELDIPVIGNGDIQNRKDILDRQSGSGADRIMIGRALMAKPWLLNPELNPDAHEAGEIYGKFLLKVLELSREHYPENLGLRRFRFLVYHGSSWLEFGHALYSRVQNVKSYTDMQKLLEVFFSRPNRIQETTTLRN